MGFEPHDLRVMSPTSYQAALPRDIKLIGDHLTSGFTVWCRKPGSNRYDTHVSRDFKSRASANSAIPANLSRAFLIGHHLIISQRRAFVNPFYQKKKNKFSTAKTSSAKQNTRAYQKNKLRVFYRSNQFAFFSSGDGAFSAKPTTPSTGSENAIPCPGV